MRGSYMGGVIGLALLGLIMNAGAVIAAGNPCSPLTYGAVGDGTVGTNNGTLNTVPIQAAINACAARGGGIVALSPVPSGENVYLTGPIQLLSHVYLEINAGVTLLATTDEGQYSIAFLNYPMPGTNVFPNTPTAPYEALVFAFQAVDTGIIGSGVINGQGNVTSTTTNRPAGTGTNGFAAGPITAANPSYVNSVESPTTQNCWWSPGPPNSCTSFPSPGNGISVNGTQWYKAPQTDIPTSNGPARPWLVEFYQCAYVTVNGITLVNSPMWNLVLRNDSHVTVTNYHVQNYSDPAATIPAPSIGTNTDGIDPVGSSYVTISNINEQVGDDDVAIKSGLPLNVVNGAPEEDPNVVGLPTLPSHDITVTNATITGGHGISIGSEGSNGVYNVLIQNINASGSGLSEVLRIKTGRTRGNYTTGIHDITVRNMVATGATQPILVYDYYPASNPPTETSNSSTWDVPQAIQPNTPNVYNIFISGLTAIGATSPAVISGVPEACILNVILNDVSITSSTSGVTTAVPSPLPAGMFQLRNVTGTFTNVTLTSTRSPAIAPWAEQENVQVTTAGTTPAMPFPYTGPGTGTGPLATTPPGAVCAVYPPGNVYPIGTIP
ncbi:MAG TPA: glycosyl hydrolase family 28 protein [Casimicrobiaceae bacterium]|nr:glycosyl hydrolase family 28 protein [Casimicrobiaceae bacterium]